MNSSVSRRTFLAAAAALSTSGFVSAAARAFEPKFQISLAQWSLHRALKGGKLDNLDFAATTRNEFGIEAVEYVNQFFKDKANDAAYLAEMNKRAGDAGVKQLLIMIDGEGQLGAASLTERMKSVENHYKWVEAAKTLGCHAIRVNAGSSGSYEDQQHRAADGLRALTEFGAKHDISVIVENHGGLSSNGAWLAGVIKKVDHKGCGTLPDFGNFRVSKDEMYDRYKGVTELMPFAKAVSAKSHDFDDAGNEIHTDYRKMMKIVLDAGYNGWVGIEYEGGKLDEYAGIKATKSLLEKVRGELA
ncbi:MAG: TIM barrel protein [Planctomycetaceae bacterium]|nr:TIM barrel protein [Planctomycetaceae bacterium]